MNSVLFGSLLIFHDGRVVKDGGKFYPKLWNGGAN